MLEIYAAGAAAAFTVDMLIYPLDTIKTRIQSQEYLKTYANARRTAAVSRPPLFRGLYQGIGSVVIATLPAAGIFFSVYEGAKSTLSPLPLAAPLIHASASALAELSSCIVLAPAEVIKQNAQMLRRDPTTTTASTLQSQTSSSLQVIRVVQPNRLWAGYLALASRNLPFTALQFPVFEYVRGIALAARQADNVSDKNIGGGRGRLLETGLVTGASAGVAGAFAAWVTTPSDVVKTRMMLSAGRKQGDRGPGTWDVASAVYRERGVGGFFRGGLLRTVWTMVGSGLYLGTYEIAKLWLEGRKRKGGEAEIG